MTAPLQSSLTSSTKKIVIWGVVVLLLLVAAGTLYATRQRVAKPIVLTHISVRLAWLNNPQFAGMYMAQAKGYYRAAGLDVDLKEFGDTTDVNKEVATGQVDFGVSTPLEVILARDKGENNKAIAAIYQTSAYVIVMQKSAHITTPSDFRGKILGALGGNNEAQVTYTALASSAGLKPSETVIKPVDFDIVKVFQSNQADTGDIYRTDQTYLLDKAGIGYDLLYPEQFGFTIYGDVLIASDTKLAHNPAQTAAFVSATMQGWQYAVDHQAETLQVLATRDNAEYRDPAYVKYDLAATAPLIRPTGGQSFGSMQYVPWNRAYQGVESSGLLKHSFSVSDFYTTQFIH